MSLVESNSSEKEIRFIINGNAKESRNHFREKQTLDYRFEKIFSTKRLPMDRFVCLLFPLCFCSFNYWGIYALIG